MKEGANVSYMKSYIAQAVTFPCWHCWAGVGHEEAKGPRAGKLPATVSQSVVLRPAKHQAGFGWKHKCFCAS